MAFIAAAIGAGRAEGLGAGDPTRTSFEVSRDSVLMGRDIAQSEWPMRLASPSAEGQFEVLVLKSAAPVSSPDCRSRYLVVRMPASIENQSAVQLKIRQYERMSAAYNQGQPIRFDVFAGPYGKRLPDGQIRLTGCNLFFVEPQTGSR